MRHTVLLKIKGTDGFFLSLERSGEDYKFFEAKTRGIALGIAKRFAARELRLSYKVISVSEWDHSDSNLTSLTYTVEYIP